MWAGYSPGTSARASMFLHCQLFSHCHICNIPHVLLQTSGELQEGCWLVLPPDLAILLLVSSSNPFFKELLFSNEAVAMPTTFPKRVGVRADQHLTGMHQEQSGRKKSLWNFT